MSRRLALALAAVVLLAPCSLARAMEMKVKGEFIFSWAYVDNGNFYDHSWDQQSEDQFHARQRTRLQIDFIASENVQGILHFEIGETQWGRGGAFGRGSGGQLGADGVSIKTKRAFMEFNVPNTELLLRVGIQGMALPGAITGSAIMDDDMAGILAMYPVNSMVTLGAFWARPFDLDANNVTSPSSPNVDEMDLFGLVGHINGDGWSFQPYAMFAAIGRDALRGFGASGSSTNPTGLLSPAHQALLAFAPTSPFYQNLIRDQELLTAWWAGGTMTLDMFDPFTIMLEGAYGSLDAEANALDRRGFYLAAELDYDLDFMTIGLMGWYGSGEDDSWTNGSERMPAVSENWTPTTFAYDGGSLLSKGSILAPTAGVNDNAAGKWALALLFKDISFVEDLTHQVRVLYARGTNAPESRRIVGAVFPNLILGYKGTPIAVPAGFFTLPGATTVPGIELTTQDYMVEVNFDHEYKLYENLALILELGMVHVQYGNDVWVHDDTSTAWKAAWGLKYKF